MAAKKVTTVLLKEEVLAVVAKYHRRAYTQKEIREKLKQEINVDVSVPMVCNYVKEIRRRYATSTQESHAALVREKVEQLDEVIREAWDAYERSKADIQKRQTQKALRKPDKSDKAEQIVEKVKVRDPGRRRSVPQEVEAILTTIKVMVTREGRIPANEFLLTIIKAHELQMKLTGVLEDRTVNNNTVNVVSIDWKAMGERSQLIDPMEQLPAIEVQALPQPSTNGDGSHA